MSTAGMKTITVSYGGKSASFNIYVQPEETAVTPPSSENNADAGASDDGEGLTAGAALGIGAAISAVLAVGAAAVAVLIVRKKS